MQKFYLFLDFDGVLHGESIDSAGLFEHISMFCDFLRLHPNKVEVVISSSWREDYQLDYLKTLFDKDVRDMIVGITPIHANTFEKGERQKEIEAFCRSNNIPSSHWIAIDDMERFFDDNCENLFLIDSQTGLTQESLTDISLIIHQKLNNSDHNKLKI